MRKIVFGLLLLASCCGSIQAQEIVRRDTTIVETERTPQPTDDHYRIVTNRFWDNWFILANVGGHAFLGDYGSVGKFSGLLSPDFNVGVGKWFTPGIGAKVQFGIGNSKGYSKESTLFTDGDWLTNSDGVQYLKSKTKWWDLNVNAMFNLSRLFKGYEGKNSDNLKNQFIASVGIGALHHYGIPQQRNEWSGHFELQYSRFFDKAKSFSLDLKARAMVYQTNFDGITLKQNGEKSVWFDSNIGLSVGFTYYFKKRHWDRCMPCENPVYINNVIAPAAIPVSDCPEYGVLEFFVFFPNNYSGRNDAPTMVDEPVNAIDYLASGIFTQTKFDDADAVAQRLASGRSLSGLRTSDVPTEKAGTAVEITGLTRGYEMSQQPISLPMDEESMNRFKEQTGYYYAPMYCQGNTWYYRVDKETAMQRLISDDNYKEVQSFGLNAHDGLGIVEQNMRPDPDSELYSFADIYAAIEENAGNVAQASDSAAVDRLTDIFEKGRVLYVVAEGLATSQDNFIGENAEEIGLERNKALAYNRAFTVVNWLKTNGKFQKVPGNAFIVNALVNPVVEVNDSSVQGLNAKVRRSVKVRIYYAID